MILQIGKFDKRLLPLFVEVIEALVEKTGERDIDFQQAATNAAPAQAFVILPPHQTARRTIMSLILPIACVGFSPFGQTSTQFMMVWQRNRR